MVNKNFNKILAEAIRKFDILAEAIRKFDDSKALENAKRCPFCGSVPIIEFDDFGCTVRCPNDDCPCSPQTNSTFTSREAAVDMWNRRYWDA